MSMFSSTTNRPYGTTKGTERDSNGPPTSLKDRPHARSDEEGEVESFPRRVAPQPRPFFSDHSSLHYESGSSGPSLFAARPKAHNSTPDWRACYTTHHHEEGESKDRTTSTTTTTTAAATTTTRRSGASGGIKYGTASRDEPPPPLATAAVAASAGGRSTWTAAGLRTPLIRYGKRTSAVHHEEEEEEGQPPPPSQQQQHQTENGNGEVTKKSRTGSLDGDAIAVTAAKAPLKGQQETDTTPTRAINFSTMTATAASTPTPIADGVEARLAGASPAAAHIENSGPHGPQRFSSASALAPRYLSHAPSSSPGAAVQCSYTERGVGGGAAASLTSSTSRRLPVLRPVASSSSSSSWRPVLRRQSVVEEQEEEQEDVSTTSALKETSRRRGHETTPRASPRGTASPMPAAEEAAPTPEPSRAVPLPPPLSGSSPLPLRLSQLDPPAEEEGEAEGGEAERPREPTLYTSSTPPVDWAGLQLRLRCRTHGQIALLDLSGLQTLTEDQWCWCCQQVLPLLTGLEVLRLSSMGLTDSQLGELQRGCCRRTNANRGLLEQEGEAGEEASCLPPSAIVHRSSVVELGTAATTRSALRLRHHQRNRSRSVDPNASTLTAVGTKQQYQAYAVFCFPALRVLDLRDNAFTYKSAAHLGKLLLCSAATLQELYLQHNEGFGDYGFQTLGVYLSKLRAAEVRAAPHLFTAALVTALLRERQEPPPPIGPWLVDVQFCGASARGIAALLGGASQAQRLTHLDVAWNVPPLLGSTAGDLTPQARLQLLSQPPFSHFPSLANLCALSRLYMHHVPLGVAVSPAGCRELLLNVFFACHRVVEVDLSCTLDARGVPAAAAAALVAEGTLEQQRQAADSARPMEAWRLFLEHEGEAQFTLHSAEVARQSRVGDVLCELLAHAAYNSKVRARPLPAGFTHLRSLLLRQSGLTDMGVRGLCIALRAGAAAGMLQLLEVLDVSGNYLTAVGCAGLTGALVESWPQPSSPLRALALHHNYSAGSEAAQAAEEAVVAAAVQAALAHRRAEPARPAPLQILYGAVAVRCASYRPPTVEEEEERAALVVTTRPPLPTATAAATKASAAAAAATLSSRLGPDISSIHGTPGQHGAALGAAEETAMTPPGYLEEEEEAHQGQKEEEEVSPPRDPSRRSLLRDLQHEAGGEAEEVQEREEVKRAPSTITAVRHGTRPPVRLSPTPDHPPRPTATTATAAAAEGNTVNRWSPDEPTTARRGRVEEDEEEAASPPPRAVADVDLVNSAPYRPAVIMPPLTSPALNSTIATDPSPTKEEEEEKKVKAIEAPPAAAHAVEEERDQQEGSSSFLDNNSMFSRKRRVIRRRRVRSFALTYIHPEGHLLCRYFHVLQEAFAARPETEEDEDAAEVRTALETDLLALLQPPAAAELEEGVVGAPTVSAVTCVSVGGSNLKHHNGNGNSNESAVQGSEKKQTRGSKRSSRLEEDEDDEDENHPQEQQQQLHEAAIRLQVTCNEKRSVVAQRLQDRLAHLESEESQLQAFPNFMASVLVFQNENNSNNSNHNNGNSNNNANHNYVAALLSRQNTQTDAMVDEALASLDTVAILTAMAATSPAVTAYLQEHYGGSVAAAVHQTHPPAVLEVMLATLQGLAEAEAEAEQQHKEGGGGGEEEEEGKAVVVSDVLLPASSPRDDDDDKPTPPATVEEEELKLALPPADQVFDETDGNGDDVANNQKMIEKILQKDKRKPSSRTASGSAPGSSSSSEKDNSKKPKQPEAFSSTSSDDEEMQFLNQHKRQMSLEDTQLPVHLVEVLPEEADHHHHHQPPPQPEESPSPPPKPRPSSRQHSSQKSKDASTKSGSGSSSDEGNARTRMPASARSPTKEPPSARRTPPPPTTTTPATTFDPPIRIHRSPSELVGMIKTYLLSYAHVEGSVLCRGWQLLHTGDRSSGNSCDGAAAEARQALENDFLALLQPPDEDRAHAVQLVKVPAEMGVSNLLQLHVETNERRATIASRLHAARPPAPLLTAAELQAAGPEAREAQQAALAVFDACYFPRFSAVVAKYAQECDTVHLVRAYWARHANVPEVRRTQERLQQTFHSVETLVHYYHGAAAGMLKELRVPSWAALAAEEQEQQQQQQQPSGGDGDGLEAVSSVPALGPNSSAATLDEARSSVLSLNHADPSIPLPVLGLPPSRNSSAPPSMAGTRTQPPSTNPRAPEGEGRPATSKSPPAAPLAPQRPPQQQQQPSSSLIRVTPAATSFPTAAASAAVPSSSGKEAPGQSEWDRLLDRKHRGLLRIAYEGMQQGDLTLDPESREPLLVAKGKWGGQRVLLYLEWDIMLVLYLRKKKGPLGGGGGAQAQMLVHPVAFGFEVQSASSLPPATLQRAQQSLPLEDKKKGKKKASSKELYVSVQRPCTPEEVGFSSPAIRARLEDHAHRTMSGLDSKSSSSQLQSLVGTLCRPRLELLLHLGNKKEVQTAVQQLREGARQAQLAVERAMRSANVPGGPPVTASNLAED